MTNELTRIREQIAENGTSYLSDSQAIALVTGAKGPKNKEWTAEQFAAHVLNTFGSLENVVAADDNELEEVGFGKYQIASLRAAVEIGLRIKRSEALSQSITNPKAMHEVGWSQIKPEDRDRENLVVICLNTKNQVIKSKVLYTGTVNAILPRAAEIMRVVITSGANTFALLHNHPSGVATPSPEDVQFTKTMIEAGNLMQAELVDHIVSADEDSFTSIRSQYSHIF